MTTPHPLESYLSAIQAIHSTGAAVDETSYYGPLADLLNTVGKATKPRVHAILQLKNVGAGLPDGGLFTEDQLQNFKGSEALLALLPARGALEVKPPNADLTWLLSTQQVKDYCAKYSRVLLTNYRAFLVVTSGEDGSVVQQEGFVLFSDDQKFWSAVAEPSKIPAILGDAFYEYLYRALLGPAALSHPQDLARFLASYARDARKRIELSDLRLLKPIRAALEEALGLKFEGKKGERFFRSSLVQTLFYGIFSAWVLWAKDPPVDEDQFDWRKASWFLHVPMIKALFYQLASPGVLDHIGLTHILDWSSDALNRVNKQAFFRSFDEGQAVQYFYQPFLAEFDPELQDELGVWFTPHEIVEYMVERVDAVLRQELGIEDGFASNEVYVLDPSVGTGSYLVAVLRRIAATLKETRRDALIGEDLKQAAMERIFGFELLPAPFVVAHLQIGLLLRNLGAPLSDSKKERVAVYLTNSLTGWEPPKGAKQHLAFPELEEERDAADSIKRSKPVIVVIGNPPYNGFAGVSPDEEHGLIEIYTKGLNKWGINKHYLNDLYVRFFRVAERRIAENPPYRGVVCFISNHSFVELQSYVVMRQHLLASFDRAWIEDLHGNREVSERAPDGRTSQTVFYIPGVSQGITRGIVTSLWLKNGKKYPEKILYRNDIDAANAIDRRQQLLESLNDPDVHKRYRKADPSKSNFYSFRPTTTPDLYFEWPTLVDLAELAPSLGLNENRHGALFDINRDALECRMKEYFNKNISFLTLSGGITRNAGRYDAQAVRERILKSEKFDPTRIQRFLFKPFDIRWCYYSNFRPLWNERRPEFAKQIGDRNSFVLFRKTAPSRRDGFPFFISTGFGDQAAMHKAAYYAPMVLLPNDQEASLGLGLGQRPNLSSKCSKYLESIELTNTNDAIARARLIWMHVLAMGYSPQYVEDNADALKGGWPRIPLPNSGMLLIESASIGERVAKLLNAEEMIDSGIFPQWSGLLRIASATKMGGGSLSVKDLKVTARWGSIGKGGRVRGGNGKITRRSFTSEEMAQFSKDLGLSSEEIVAVLGDSTIDVYLNSDAYFENIPIRVWEFMIAGYQVTKKWLSYRDFRILGRALMVSEVRQFSNICRRISALLLMGPTLDANYRLIIQSLWKAPS